MEVFNYYVNCFGLGYLIVTAENPKQAIYIYATYHGFGDIESLMDHTGCSEPYVAYADDHTKRIDVQ